MPEDLDRNWYIQMAKERIEHLRTV
jgi:hypothetical protein